MKLLVGKPENVVSISSFPSSLLFSNTATFEQHLKSRSEEISSTISHLFAQSSVSSPETSELQAKIIQLLAAEKTHLTELDKSRLEKEQLEERLESASMRYMVAEKKLDRAKSMTVAKLERQATAGGRSEAGSGLGGGLDSSGISKGDMTNGLVENGDINSDAEEARKSAVAASAKQKEQIEKLEAENDKLSGQFTALNNKMSHLSDDDYARTDLFKQLKSQHEEVIKRINDLEATNVKLREEAEKLQSERTAYRVQLENETQTAIAEKDALLARAESDLARIRTGRDELTADLQVRKATQDQDRASVRQTKELSLTREERIKALESEIERLRVHAGQTDCLAVSSSDLEQLPIEELRTKYANLDRQYSMLGQELSSMGTAYKRASTLASQKILDASTLEEKVMRLGAEKSKADQKYFSAMKAKEAREQEVRTLRAQNSKSSEIVSSLKEAEAASRALVAKIEAQSGEVKDALNTMTNRNRTTQQQLVEKNFVIEGLKNQVEELKKNAIAKDASSSTAATSFRRAEVEIEELKSKLADTKKSLETWRSRGHGDQSGGSAGYEALRVCLFVRVDPSMLTGALRFLPYAPSAGPTSKIRASRLAAMSSANPASKSA